MRSSLWSSLPLALLLGSSTLCNAQDADALAKALADGGVEALFPTSPGYANASTSYNQRFVFSPFAIAYPVGAEQISTAIKAGVAQDLDIVSRSGGHSYIANSLGGKNGSFVVDLSKNKNVAFDEGTGIATLQTGLRLGDVILGLNEYGRAMPHGRCSFVGIGGHSAHGGWGHFSRNWGLVVDVVKSATVVLADGTIQKASESENTDLFWALRGSGSSYGIVAEIEVQTFLQPPEITIFTYDWASLSSEDTITAISTFQEYALSGIPSTLGGELFVKRGAQEGEIGLQFAGGYLGSHDSFNATVQPYLAKLPAYGSASTLLQTNSWVDALTNWTFMPLNTSSTVDYSDQEYMKSIITPEDDLLTDEAIESFVSFAAHDGFNTNLSYWQVEIELYGGSNSAQNAVPSDATAFPHRNGLFNLQILTSSFQEAYPQLGFDFADALANSLISAEHDDWAWTSYVGYPDLGLGDDALDLYYGDGLPRLKELKKVYDPQDVFKFPYSIPLE